MKNIINISHIVICLCLQAVFYVLTKNLYSGVLAGMFFFAGREIAQAEYRHIESLPSRLRKDMPMFGGLDPRYWNMKSLVADVTVPSTLVLLIALLF